MRATRVSILTVLTLTMACEATELPREDARGASALAQSADASPAEAYFLGREDTRDCDWPACGGFYVRPVGLASISCLDGTSGAECRVALLDPDPMGGVILDGFGEGRMIVRGNMESGESSGFGPAPSLQARAAWRSVGGAVTADAELYLVKGAPESLTATRLGAADAKPIGSLARDAVKLSVTQEEELPSMLGADGVIVTGTLAGDPAVLTVTQLLFPVAVGECVSTPDCATTRFPKRVRSAADCYCPTCPQVGSPVDAPKNEASWNQLCAQTHGASACRAKSCDEPFGSCTAGICRPINNL